MNHNRKMAGRTLIVATVVAVCAALVPSSASAALPKKVSANNDYTVASCSFAKEQVNVAAGTMTLKITASARPKGFNGFKNTYTQVVCATVDPGYTTYKLFEVFNGKTTINQVTRIQVDIADVGFFCAGSYTEQKSGANSTNGMNCVPA